MPAKNVVSVAGYMKPDEKKELEKQAEKDGRTVSNLVAKILREWLKKQKKA